MKIDQEIFKRVFGREYNVIDEKDIMATVSLHFLINMFGVHSEPRDYGYVLTDKGLVSIDCRRDILSQFDDLKERQFSEMTLNVLASLNIALESAAEILGKPFDERDAMISAAVYKYINAVLFIGFEDEETVKHEFQKRFPAGDCELGKTCSEQAEIVYNSIIESNAQKKSKDSENLGKENKNPVIA